MPSAMAPVKTIGEVENVAKKAAEALYGKNIRDFKVRVVFPFPSERKKDSWDVQVTFLLNGVQYTVDLMIEEKDGHITNARLIDKMTPL
jgi:hypothetical protein